MNKILIYHKIDKLHQDYLANKFEDCSFLMCTTKEEMEKHIKDADVLITFKFDKEMLEKGNNLKWIQALSAGVENYPLEKIKDSGIVLTNGRGIHKVHMAEYAICIMIMLSRNMHIMFKNKYEGIWDRKIEQDEINGATVGILGLGSIGIEIAKKAHFMGMNVIGVKGSPSEIKYVDKLYSPEEISQVFKNSDYVINLFPSVDKTYKIIDKKYFDMMKEDACFINMGRGSTVNEEDMIQALRNGKMKAMASDVFFMEPLPEDSPLWKLENVIITPHICGESKKYFEKALPIIENNIKAFKGKGNFINLVNFEKGY
ncbi:MAG: D-2-hydroxyacid dehydrogenase [Firmicutes bacterium]|nr:D-2-hydroxyacid dehydrogenase [Bacillota bacterium]